MKPLHPTPFYFTQEGGISVLRDATGKPIGRLDRKADAAYIASALADRDRLLAGIETLKESLADSHRAEIDCDIEGLHREIGLCYCPISTAYRFAKEIAS